MHFLDELCANFVNGEVNRRDFIKRATQAGIGMAGISFLLEACSGGQQSTASNATSGGSSAATSGAFDWKRYSGTKIHLQLSKHPYVQALMPQIPEFQRLTGIDVTYEITPEEQYFDKLKLGLSQKSSSFDIFMLGAYMTWEYGPAGWLEDLGPYVKDSAKTAADWDVNDFFPNTISNDSWDGTPGDSPGSGSAHQWAFPWGWEINVLVYRKDIFRKHGLTVPATYPQLVQTAMKLKSLEPKMIPFLARGGLSWDTIHPGYLSGFHSYGARDFDDNLKPAMNSPQGVEFTDLFVNLVKNYGPPPGRWTGYGVFDVAAAMGAGDLCMFHDATSLAYFQDLPGASAIGGQGKIGVSVSPNKSGGDHGSNIWIWSLGMNSASTNKDAAWYFIQWATSKEYLLKAATRGHADTTRKSVFNSPQYVAMLSNHAGYLETFRRQAPQSKIFFTPQPLFFTTTTNWAGVLQDIYGGKTTTKAGLDKLASDIAAQFEQHAISK
jgi:multiple sugar transport system substrate-binding protein